MDKRFLQAVRSSAAFSHINKIFFLAFSVLAISAGAMILNTHTFENAEYPETAFNGYYELASFTEQLPEISRAETIMRALAAAHPQRISSVEFRDGDWAFQVRGNWFYYAEGRLLPYKHRSRAAEFRPWGFNFNYPADLPSWESTAEQRAERTRRWEEAQNELNQRADDRQPQYDRQLPRRANYFFEALWNITNSNEAWNQQVRMNFLGRPITIHSEIAEKMSKINEIIMNEARTDDVVRQWIDSLGIVQGWNWRNIAGSGNRSFHSYGVAIDLLPRNLRGRATYWLWSARYYPQWWNIPFSRRYHPPEVVIRAFESFGFIWGGKWTHFDTMHFEYRPEIFVLSGIELATLPSLIKTYAAEP